MKRLALPLLLISSFALTGCAASLAMSAIGAAARAAGAGKERVVTEDRRPAANAACTARAAQHGTVHIIDTEQLENGRVTVWGTVQDAHQRRSFECVFTTKVDAFRLRQIRTR